MLKAIIFDMDGVIIDSEPLHARANILALKKYGVDLSLDYVYQFIGNTILYMCQTLKKDYSLDISAEELSQESARQIEYLHSIEGYTPVPYVKELIKNLYENGMKLAIASSSTEELIQKIVDVFEIRPYFTALVSGTTVTHSKPAPDIFLKACEELGVLPEEAIIIEDAYNGVLAASRANITAIGYQNPHSGNQDLSLASMIVEGFEDIDYQFIQQVYCHSHNLPAQIAVTDRVILREIPLDDVDELYQLYQDPSFQANHLSYATSLADAKEKHAAYIKHMYHFQLFGLWGVYQKDTNELIGHCGIEHKEVIYNNEQQFIYELCYGIKSSNQRQGYATECIQAITGYAKEYLYINELYTVIADTNTASIAVAKSIGFLPLGPVMHVGTTGMSTEDSSNISFSLYKKDL